MNPAWQLVCMSRPIPPTCKTRNWPAYNNALKHRGSLTIWFDPDMVWVPPPTGKRSRPPQYSDAAIQTCLTLKALYGMALRQTTGFVESLLRPIGLDRGRAGLQHAEPAPKVFGSDHPLSRLKRPVEPSGRQHRHQGRGRRRMANGTRL